MRFSYLFTRCFWLLTLALFLCNDAVGRDVKKIIKKHVTVLTSRDFHGRGYVFDGGKKAAEYIADKFKLYGLLPFEKDSTFWQPYSFPINTFPGEVSLNINNTKLVPGVDYIVNAASSSYHTDGWLKLRTIDLCDVKDAERWNAIKYFFKDPEYGYFIKNSDTVSKYLKFSIRSIAKEFPKGLFILSKHGKMIWTANTDTVGGTIITVQDSVLPEQITKVKADIDAEYIQKFKTQNVVGYVRGTEKPDSFIVFSAHYDHLGEMGEGTIFPGASDNASGTSLVLYLARYFAEHPQKYSIAFMLFSGEEAGLLGSTHYVQYPLFPLSQIKFLINLDITGDATNGITMVNGQANINEYNLMTRINEEQDYLPKINNREQTQNSDHYPFCNVGVKGIFIYGLGTKPYYHDVFDTADEITLENIDALSNLLIDFVVELPGK